MTIELKLETPDGNHIEPGDIVFIKRFATARWMICYGWYTSEGNRPVNGWYLTCGEIVKPLHLTDLSEIFKIER